MLSNKTSIHPIYIKDKPSNSIFKKIKLRLLKPSSSKVSPSTSSFILNVSKK